MKYLVASISALALALAMPAYANNLNLSVEVLSSSTTSTTTTPPQVPSGSGGGGGGSTVTSNTGVTVTGKAYPLSRVSVLLDGVKVVSTIAGPDAAFSATITRVDGGTHTISVYAEDTSGERSTLFSFPLMVTNGATTAVSGIYIAPTIDVDKSQVKQGDPIAIFGRSTPNSGIAISVHSATEIQRSTVSDKDGIYLYYLDSGLLEMGTHEAQSKATKDAILTPQSQKMSFIVGTENVQKSLPPKSCHKADINCDGHVNLVDYSILAYWYKRAGTVPERVDINKDGSVQLSDFSILAYYWTG
jgi:hypothetical protein